MSLESGSTSPHDRERLQNVFPDDWENPEARGRYNLVVVGAGSAGLISAALAAGLGARVALVEARHLGGDCLNTGCVPSKSLIRAARMVAEARRAQRELGLELAADAAPDFGRVMERMREIRARISHEDAALRYRDELGVDVFLGRARFTGRDRVEVEGRELRFARAIVASGARPSSLPIPGLEAAGPLTNESIFDLETLPESLAVIGGGPIGCELAQTFARLGSRVTLLHADTHLLPREDPDAASILETRLRAEGLQIEHGARIQRVEGGGHGATLHFHTSQGEARQLASERILVAVGRSPNVEDMGLETAGVAYDARRGVHVDDFLRTRNPRIYAAGDVCLRWQFTHAADAAAKIAVRNALFSLGPLGRARVSKLVMPWCTYTDPEIAHVGLSAAEAQARNIEVDSYTLPLSEANRAITDGEEEGLLKIHQQRGRDRIVGATLVAPHAGESIGELALAMSAGQGLGKLLDVIHPYPTLAQLIPRAAGLRARERLSPTLHKWLQGFMRLRA